MGPWIPTEQLRNCIRTRGFKYRKEQKRTQLWRGPNGGRVNLPMRQYVDVSRALLILRDAGLTPDEAKRFVGEYGVQTPN